MYTSFRLIVLSIVSLLASYAVADQPNIIVILCDDLGYGDLGCYGHPHIKTPNLDQMADDGMRFTDFYSAAPVCSPSRVGLLTGRSPNRAGVYEWIPHAKGPAEQMRNKVHLRGSEVTIPQLLKEAGYATAMAGKWHCNSLFNSEEQAQPDDAGFDYWFGTQNNAVPSHRNPRNFVRNGEEVGEIEGYSCQIVVDEGLKWVSEQQKKDADQPFFLYLSFHEAHEPVASPEEIIATYRGIASNEEEATYFANVENVDRAVGRVIDYLKETGVDENTLLVFTSDNGPETLNRYERARLSWGRADPLRGMKLWTTEAGFRVPGIMRWPGEIEAGQVSNQVMSSLDFLPTFCALSGATPPEDLILDGANVLPVLRNERFEREKPLLWAYYYALNEHRIAMRDGKWKVLAQLDLPKIRNLYRGNIDAVKAAKIVDVQIFDMEHDVGEMRDLAKSYPELKERLEKKLKAEYAELLEGSHIWE